jgi:hypothetical protein
MDIEVYTFHLNNTLMKKQKHLVANKLCRLSSFLDNAYKEFDTVAKHIKDKNIKMSVRSFALKSKQYMEELNSQLKMLRIKYNIDRTKEQPNKEYVDIENISDKRIIEMCCDSEIFFSKAYHSLLNEFFPYKPLRSLLRYQLTGIYAAFRQLKLLNSVMPPGN